MKKLFCLVFGLFAFSIAVFAEEGSFPWLDSLDAGEGVRDSGAQLVGLPFGLHLLEKPNNHETELLIGVHGWRSRGYEWVYPLKTMDNEDRRTYFFNWDTSAIECQNAVAESLQQSIVDELSETNSVETVIVVGHSLGGMVVAQLADSWISDTELDIHTIASPLKGLEQDENDKCPQSLPKNQSQKVRFFQWRTQFELDNAFNQLDYNPMEVEIPNSVVVTLPDTYREHRLGHNWAVSFVAERIAETPSNANEEN